MKPHPIYTKYLITQDGRVVNSITGKECKQRENDFGYMLVSVEKSSKRVHRLVAETYLENPQNKREVNHKDCDKKNNHVDNLEWVSSKENKAHAWEHNLYSDIAEDHYAAIWSNDEIHQICKMLEDGVSNKVISEITGMHKDQVAHIKRGDLWASISSQYNIIRKSKERWSDDLIETVCRMLSEGVHYAEIARTLSLPDRSVNRIQNRKLHTRISDKYKW